MFHKILVANRGEIAVRIIRACSEMGIASVAVYSELDRDALHTQLADEAICIGPMQLKDSYLNMDRIISAAIACGADAIHPGFGFLSENSQFAKACEQHNITFIGPSAEVIEQMGNKTIARQTMKAADVCVVPGSDGEMNSLIDAKRIANEIGYPVMLKASAGGGGKGMRIITSEDGLEVMFDVCRREALSAFGDDSMYMEKYINPARHIEYQIIADKEGNVIQLGERECSIQRRHQKLIEEAPSTAICEETRRKMGEVAVKAAKAAHYTTVGTIEFIVDAKENFYFLEMNTRIQVEHGVTELTTGIDLMKEQIRLAAGELLSIHQEDIVIDGHVIECRINAENPKNHFQPSPGTIEKLHFPGGNGVRIDSALYVGYTVPPIYDSLIAKILVKDQTRENAIAKMKHALQELVIEGVDTNKDFLCEVLEHDNYVKNQIDTSFIEKMDKECQVTARNRLDMILDSDSFREWNSHMPVQNPLDYPGYESKLRKVREETALDEGIITGSGTINHHPVAIGVMDGRFFMGSMGYVVGEKITYLVEEATKQRLPVVIFCCSGGARMQEGIVSLMQMVKTSQAIKKHDEAGLLYISVLTNPTMGGVTASFAMLADVILAEPKALIGFAGPRVIEQTTKLKLPEGFQQSEFLLEHGFIDRIVTRDEMKQVLSMLLQ